MSVKQENCFRGRARYYILMKDYRGKLSLFHSSESTSCLRLCFGLWSAFVSWSACCGRSLCCLRSWRRKIGPSLSSSSCFDWCPRSLMRDGPCSLRSLGQMERCREKSIDCRNQYSLSRDQKCYSYMLIQ